MEKTDHIGLYINVASHCIRRKMDSYSAPLGLSGIQMRILGFLDNAENRNQAIYQRDIEKHFGIRRSSVTSVISNLEQKSLVKRETVSGDARLKQLVLTNAGRETNRIICHNINDMESELAACFSAQQHDALIQMLQTIIEKLDTDKTGYCK
ncbi:MAG: MarR family winged helix-turn-helix transcriptional regulator [Eubacteriales bacterium]|nr:MarR family winged helix-turn-helix transcriptional regulator [Eubacteriales bacterium]